MEAHNCSTFLSADSLLRLLCACVVAQHFMEAHTFKYVFVIQSRFRPNKHYNSSSYLSADSLSRIVCVWLFLYSGCVYYDNSTSQTHHTMATPCLTAAAADDPEIYKE